MSNMVTPFSGPSQKLVSVGQAAGAPSEDELMKAIFSPKAREEFAKECKLGMFNSLRVDQQFNHIDLVPKAQHSAITKIFKSKYDRGELPSSGLLSIPRLLVFIVRTVSTGVTGSVTISMVDSGMSLGVIDNQSTTLELSSLPALVAFSPSYDCPLEQLGNRIRCFGVKTELRGVTGCAGTVVMCHQYWSANFRAKPGNYRERGPAVHFVAPFDRLRQLDRKALVRYVRGISNVEIDRGLLLGERASVSTAPRLVLEEEVKDAPKTVHNEVSGKAVADVVAGLPVNQAPILTKRR